MLAHAGTVSRSVSSTGDGSRAGAPGRRRRRSVGVSASTVPSATTAPPIQIHTSIGLIAIPIVTRPRWFGDETSVR